MKYRFFSRTFNHILGHGYPYFLKPDGNVVIVNPKITKKEADYDEQPANDIDVHLCSGLQDKKQQWIFEEDIINYNNNQGVVRFKSGCFIVEDMITHAQTVLLKVKQENREIISNTIATPAKKIQKKTVAPDLTKVKLKTK